MKKNQDENLRFKWKFRNNVMPSVTFKPFQLMFRDIHEFSCFFKNDENSHANMTLAQPLSYICAMSQCIQKSGRVCITSIEYCFYHLILSQTLLTLLTFLYFIFFSSTLPSRTDLVPFQLPPLLAMKTSRVGNSQP